MPGVRLEWDGKTAEVPRLHLPLQVVETGNAPRADRGTLFERCDVVLRVALASGAQEVVVAHNHVGRNAPSDADLAAPLWLHVQLLGLAGGRVPAKGAWAPA
jgi:hypothetical protein